MLPNHKTSWLSLYLLLTIAIILLILLTFSIIETQGAEIGQLKERTDPRVSLIEQAVKEQTVAQTIAGLSRTYGADPNILVALAACESSLNPRAVGGTHQSFRGLYQWNKRSNPEITDDCAFSVHCSTIATINALQRNEEWRWPVCIQ